MTKTREFRSQKSFDAEAVTRAMISPFLNERGFVQIRDERRRFGRNEQQIVHATSPTDQKMAIHVRLCWNREPGNQRQKHYSAAQLLSKVTNNDWIGSLRQKAARDLSKGVTHTLVVQREGSVISDAVLIPIAQLVDIWIAQRDLSSDLIADGVVGRKRKNHTMNGSSPTLWLHDEGAPAMREVLLQWPGVVNLAMQPTRTAVTPPSLLQRSSRKGVRNASEGTLTETAKYLARLTYNSERWWRPTGKRDARESGDTYRSKHGFGHEDWLFRNEWLLDGWRYSFVQGINRSRPKLLESGKPFDLRLFTMPARGDRRAIASIREVECLTDELAAGAVEAYEQMGWLNTMRAEVIAVGGDVDALGATEYAPYVLNMRYRLDKVEWLDADTKLPPSDSIHKIKRYSLCEVHGAMDTAVPAWRGRAGTDELPPPEERKRFVTGGWTTFSPEHIRMQRALVEQLRGLFPNAEIVCEQDFVDVMVRTDTEVLLFEVKSDMNPLSVVRQALGQVLEYAYHPRHSHDLPLRLIIAGRRPLEGADLAYFELLTRQFSLPLSYWHVQV